MASGGAVSEIRFTHAQSVLLLVTSVVTSLLIVMGGVVCMTGSGLGCPDWPMCYGQIIPPVDMGAIIETTHRFLAALTSPLIVAAAVVGWRKHRSIWWLSRPAAIAVALVLADPWRLETIAGVDKRLRSARKEGASVRHHHFDTVSAEAGAVADMIGARLLRGSRPRDVAILVRSNADADPFLRALNVKGIPHRFSGRRGLYAREEVRLLVHFLGTLANPDDSVSLFYLAGSEVYHLPERDLLRLSHYARRKTRPLLEVLRGLPDNEELASVGGAARDGERRTPGFAEWVE